MESGVKFIVFESGVDSASIIEQFFSSDYVSGNQLNIDKFLDSDSTIDIEKLELAIILLIEKLENSVKIENAIYVFLGNMQEYFSIRGVTDLDRIIEESSFILGFCKAVAEENKIDRDVIISFRGKDL